MVESLFESELFGHVRGAFTGAVDSKVGLFEHADGGTLFLDEAGELPLSVQAKLLRAVEYGEVQRVGALDTRHVDVNARFIRECAGRLNRPITGLTQSAERLLFNAPWPGNIRELRNVLERSCILSEGG